MVASHVSGCTSSSRAKLIAQAISIACIRTAHPGNNFECLDLILEMLSAELWRASMSVRDPEMHAAGIFQTYSEVR